MVLSLFGKICIYYSGFDKISKKAWGNSASFTKKYVSIMKLHELKEKSAPFSKYATYFALGMSFLSDIIH